MPPLTTSVPRVAPAADKPCGNLTKELNVIPPEAEIPFGTVNDSDEIVVAII